MMLTVGVVLYRRKADAQASHLASQAAAPRNAAPGTAAPRAVALLAAALLAVGAMGASPAYASSPTVESESASNVTATDATLEATIDPQSAERGAYYQFQVVLDPSEYRPKFACPSEGFPAGSSICSKLESEPHALALGLTEAGTQALKESIDVASLQPFWMSSMKLTPNTTYHYRVIVARSLPSEDQVEWEEPIVYGPDQVFTTPEEETPSPPPSSPSPSPSPPAPDEGSTASAPPPVSVATASLEVKPKSTPAKHHKKHHKRKHHKRRHKHKRHHHRKPAHRHG